MTNPSATFIERFPHPTLTTISGPPTYASIWTLHLELNANAASISSPLGNGSLGLLGLTVSPEVYKSLSGGVSFKTPTDPGPTPTINNDATVGAIASETTKHKNELIIYQNAHTTQAALKQLLLAAVDNTYLLALKDNIIGFANVTIREFMSHLYTTYGNITPAALKDNHNKLTTPYDPTMPIEHLFQQIEEARDFADAGDQ